MQRRPDFSDQSALAGSVTSQPTVRMHPNSVPIMPKPEGPDEAVALPASGVPSAPPTSSPDGGLATYLGTPARATQVASAVREAQERAQQDIASVARSLAEIATVLHSQAGQLEQVVEGSFANDLADPRTKVLAQSLSIARQADLHLARLGSTLRRLSEAVQTAQSNLDALQQERERLT